VANKNDTIGRTVMVALVLSFVFSVVVSTAAVVLKPVQIENRNLDMKSNILAAAGLLEPGATTEEIEEKFKLFDVRLVDLETGEYVGPSAVGVDDPMLYDQYEASSNPERSINLSPAEDQADIKRRANIAKVFIYKQDGEIQRIVLPVHGYGLWSTLYGFLALQGDADTIAGLTFYDHAETPGLGGEVDNPAWKAKWPGKEVYADNVTEPAIQLVKGSVGPDTANREYKVDGLAGATLTSRGVTNLLQFWMGDMGFASYLKKLREGEV
jgi:Na+-transporting NADH:ubiquinone oxidoreductase subunit C